MKVHFRIIIFYKPLLTKYLGVGKDWFETEVPTLRDVLRKGLHIQDSLLLSEGLERCVF